ncbi:MAG: ABC transporter substrate-binding protein [Jiangellaceae bacterium]
MRPAVGLRAATGALAVTTLVGCGVGDLVAGADESIPKVAKIVVLVPGEGTLAGAGSGVLGAVELAVNKISAVIPGWTVEVVAAADGGDGADLAAVAETLAGDDEVAAVIGGLSSESVRAVQPVLAAATIPFVSPADVAPEHTRGADPAAPMRPYSTYFRTAVTGGDPVTAAAGYAVHGLGASRVAIVDGGMPAEAARFGRLVRGLGADVVATSTATADGAGVDPVIAAAVDEGAGAVYVSGDAALAATVAKKIAGTELDARVLGGVGMHTDAYLSAAGTAADGTVVFVAPTLDGPDSAAQADLEARLAEQGLAAPGPYAAAAYDAGSALVQVLSRCLPPEDTAAGAREGCLGEMDQLSFAGVTGTVAFDRYGDRAGSHPVAFEVRDGEWAEVGS